MSYIHLPWYLMMFGPKLLLLLTTLVLFRRDRSLIAGIAVLSIALSAFGTVWGIVHAPVLVPSVGGTGAADFVPAEPPPSQWTTYDLEVGGLWIGLLALLIYVLRKPMKRPT